MLSRSIIRASTAQRLVARRGFLSIPKRFGSQYHYPEGPGSNLPFNIKTKYFGLRYWGTMGNFSRSFHTRVMIDNCIAFFFGLPFMIAGKCKHDLLQGRKLTF